jgi:hypothetical protein
MTSMVTGVVAERGGGGSEGEWKAKELAVGAVVVEARWAQEARACLRALGWQKKGANNITVPTEEVVQQAVATLRGSEGGGGLLALHLNHNGTAAIQQLTQQHDADDEEKELSEKEGQLRELLREGRAVFMGGLRAGMKRNERLPDWPDDKDGQGKGEGSNKHTHEELQTSVTCDPAALTHLLTHPATHSPTHSRTHSLTHPLSLTNLLQYSEYLTLLGLRSLDNVLTISQSFLA